MPSATSKGLRSKGDGARGAPRTVCKTMRNKGDATFLSRVIKRCPPFSHATGMSRPLWLRMALILAGCTGGKDVIILRMKDALMLTACVLSSGLLAASTVAVPTLPPSEYADTEVSTDVSLVARGHVAHDESINVKTDRNAMRIIRL